MVQVKIKRVYEPEEKSDGFRVLTDRLWPRGIRKENLNYDLWEKDLAPSTPLRKWFHQDSDTHWQEFRRRYIDELKQSPALTAFLSAIRDRRKITLLYASRNTTENQAVVLKELIEKELE